LYCRAAFGAAPCDNDAPTGWCLMAKRFSQDILANLHDGKTLRIRAGSGSHRFIGIWVVVVNGRVFVRSWSLKPHGWYRTFLEVSRGRIQIDEREIPIRAVHTRSEPLKDAVDRAFVKYSTGWEIKYAKDLVSEKSRDATMELVPASSN
jgi:hypothetical protein